MKRKLALLLSICMLLSMVPASFAQELTEAVEMTETVETTSANDEDGVLDIEDDGEDEAVTEFTGDFEASPYGDEEDSQEADLVEVPEEASAPERTGADGDDGDEDCAHENAYEDSQWVRWDYEEIPGDDMYHSYIYVYVNAMFCPDCGEYFDCSDEEYYGDPCNEPHSYDENGVCTDCNHKNSCQEHEWRQDYSWNEVSYTQIEGDKANHTATGEAYVYQKCTRCGIQGEGYTDEGYIKVEKHSFDGDGLCNYCGYQCPHDAFELDSYTDYDDEESRYVLNEDDPNTHVWLDVYHSEYGYCQDCEQYITKPLNEDYEELGDPERHSWENGKCEYCGAENTCKHDDGNQHESSLNANYTYEPIEGDSKYHKLTYDETEAWYCPTCGDYYNLGTTHRVESTESHYYDEEGVCNGCGYECQHPNTEAWWSAEDDDVIEYEAVDAEHHRRYTQNAQTYDYCPDCGMSINVQENQGPMEEIELHTWVYDEDQDADYCQECGQLRCNHIFENGECKICDYECPHESTYDSEDYDYVCIQVEGNNLQHLCKEINYRYTICKLCDEVLKKENIKEEDNWLEVHDYDASGVCEECGFVRNCEHVHQYTRDTEVVVEERADAEKHYITYQPVLNTRCSDCGETLGSVNNGEPYTQEELHEWDEGKCWNCGYQCVHDMHEESHWEDFPSRTYSLETERLSVEDAAKVNAGTHHRTLGTYTTLMVCGICGWDEEYEEESIEDYAIAEPHLFNANGVCELCGKAAVTACDHPEAQREDIGFYAPDGEEPEDKYRAIDDERHEVFKTYQWKKVLCGECGQEFLVEGTFEVHVDTEDHNYRDEEYDNSDTCWDCGHKCQHPEMKISNEWEDCKISADEGAVTAEGHLITKGTYTPYGYCYICDWEYMPSPITVENQRLPHEFVDGVCTVCDYTPDCKHEHISDEEIDVWLDTTYEQITGNNAQHTVIQNYKRGYPCEYCGKLDETKGIRPYTERDRNDHDYDDKGVCKDCGFVNTCKHGETFVDNDYPDEDSWAVVDDENGHAWHRFKNVVERCVFCRVIQNVLAENVDDIDYYDDHRFENGKCVECGYVKNSQVAQPDENGFSVADGDLLQYSGSAASVTLPGNVTSIYDHAFAGNATVTSVTLTSSVKSIGAKTFMNCAKLTSITIPDSVTSIGKDAFAGCDNLTIKTSCNSAATKYAKENNVKTGLTHTAVDIPAKAATCTATGLKAGKKCSVCGEILVKQETVPAAGHKAATVKGKAATCTATGLTDGAKCSVCGAWTTPQKAIAKLAHTPVTVKGYAATYEKAGLTDGAKCSVCGTWITPQKAIAKLEYPTWTLSKTKGTLTVNVGDKVRIVPKFATSAGAKVTGYKSAKAKLASVNASGLVTGVAEGSTKITVTTNNKKKKATITVKVIDPYKPTGVGFKQGKSVTVKMGQTFQLNAVLKPAKARTTLTWKSNKPKVAAVDKNGRITPVSEGTAKITVTTKNKKKATITVKVVDPYKPTGVVISQGKSVTLKVGQTLKLSATLKPVGAKTKLTWKSDKKAVAAVDSTGKVTAKKKGKAKITVTTANKKKATITITVTAK